MTINQPTNEAANAFANMFRSFDSQPYLDLQRRTFDAFARVSNKMGHAAAEIGERQLEVIRSFATLSAPNAQNGNHADGLSGLWESQIEVGKSFFQKATEQMRQVNTLLRDCTADVTSEIEACTRDNLKTIGANMEKMRTQAEQNAETAMSSLRAVSHTAEQSIQHAAQAGSDAMRKTAEMASETARKAGDNAAKAMRNSPAAE